ncbi:MAG: CoA transferase, partial [Deltaproteobacteria bacterium]|nr:CoA transferase [Deltaproteobacteria bacterium]
MPRRKLSKTDSSPLRGIRVCAFTHVAAGPYATLQLATLGAEVIKVETSTRIDYWRYRDRNDDPESSRPFADHNKNVRSVTINLKQPEGIELARRLVSASDVVVDNHSAGVMDQLGLGFEQLKSCRSDIIVVHMTGLGMKGPRSRTVTFGPNLMSFCGMTYLWNHPGQRIPVGSQSSYPDYLAGVYAAFTIVAALHVRQRSNKPQLVDLSQAMVLASSLGPCYLEALNGSGDPQPQGNTSLSYAPHNCYPCRGGDDAWCV